jgi:hypothetical protein
MRPTGLAKRRQSRLDREFTNGPKAAAYDRIIDSVEPEELVTSVVVLYEVYREAKKVKEEETALEPSQRPAKRRWSSPI